MPSSLVHSTEDESAQYTTKRRSGAWEDVFLDLEEEYHESGEIEYKRSRDKEIDAFGPLDSSPQEGKSQPAPLISDGKDETRDEGGHFYLPAFQV